MAMSKEERARKKQIEQDMLRRDVPTYGTKNKNSLFTYNGTNIKQRLIAESNANRQMSIEAKRKKMKAARVALEKKARAKSEADKKARYAEEDANDPTLKQYPDLKRKR